MTSCSGSVSFVASGPASSVLSDGGRGKLNLHVFPFFLHDAEQECLWSSVTSRVRSAHLSPGLPTGLTRVNPGWVLSLILEKVGNTG